MKKTTVHAIFDIGKTNKKLFLFNGTGEIVWKITTTFPTIEDDDGFPSDDLTAIESWMQETIKELMAENRWHLKTINFSGYGASLVYLDENGERLPLFINYLKPYPEQLELQFFKKYGPKEKFCRETASPWLGMLNSGLQIYWLKYHKPDWFDQVKYVLHFPQYLSYLFSGTPVAEYTSIGCHTGMWDYHKKNYHRWIFEEDIRELLPPIMPSDTLEETFLHGQSIQIGTGLHDTSASLIPYLKSENEPFILLSTGTWALAVNPFSTDALSRDDLVNDCLNFLRIDGEQVRTARLFLGREHEIQVGLLSEHFGVENNDYLNLEWNESFYETACSSSTFPFDFEHLTPRSVKTKNKSIESYVDGWILAYYQLMEYLVDLQIEAIHRAAGSQEIRRLIIEGGFVHNNIYVELLRKGLAGWEVRKSDIQGGSARGVYELVK